MASVRLAPPEGQVTILVAILLSSLRLMYWPRRALVLQQVQAAPYHLLERFSIHSMLSQDVEPAATSPLATISVEPPSMISGVTYSMARRIFRGSSVLPVVEFDPIHAHRMCS